MVNRGVMSQPYWWDEQWTISVQHTEADIDQHLAAFADIADVAGQRRSTSEWERWRRSSTSASSSCPLGHECTWDARSRLSAGHGTRRPIVESRSRYNVRPLSTISRT